MSFFSDQVLHTVASVSPRKESSSFPASFVSASPCGPLTFTHEYLHWSWNPHPRRVANSLQERTRGMNGVVTSVVTLCSCSHSSSLAISRGLLGIIPSSALWPLGSHISLLPIRALPALSQTSESSGKLVWCGCHSCRPPPWEHHSFLLLSLTFPKVASGPHAMTCLLPFQWSLFSCLCYLPVKPGSLHLAGGHPTASC